MPHPELLERVRAPLPDLGAANDDVRAVMRRTEEFLLHDEDRDAFARDVGPLLLRLTEHATRVQLAGLDACAKQALSDLTPEDRETLQVVVLGDHQARVRSLAMQYFQKVLGEQPGEDRRVAFGESIETEEEALVLIGKRRLDFAIAKAFFGDERRLQRDILGDAAKKLLGELA
jgi:hypothetical protein